LPRSMPTERICMSMILLEPANKITHCNVEIKRRTISLTGVWETCSWVDAFSTAGLLINPFSSHPKMLYRAVTISRNVAP
jgi:hypothetical protein